MLTDKQEKIFQSCNNIILQGFTEMVKKRDEFLKSSLLKNVTPPIKRELTRGKLKWRGIKLMHQHETFKDIYWIEQRGERISPNFYIMYEL